MIYTKRRRAFLAKALISYSNYLFVGLVVGQLIVMREQMFLTSVFILGVLLVIAFLILAYFTEPSEG